MAVSRSVPMLWLSTMASCPWLYASWKTSSSSGDSLAQLRLQRARHEERRAQVGQPIADGVELVDLAEALHQQLLHAGVDLAGQRALVERGEVEGAVAPREDAEDALEGRHLVEVVDRGEDDDALAQVDLAHVVVGADDERAALLRRAEELEQVGQGDLVDGAGHGARLRGAARRSASRRGGASARWDRAATTLRMLVPMRTRSPSFSEARLIFSPLTKVPLVEPRSSMTICRPVHRDARVLARDHVLDEDHVEVARAADDDLAWRAERELAALVLAGDEAQARAGARSSGLGSGAFHRRAVFNHAREDPSGSTGVGGSTPGRRYGEGGGRPLRGATGLRERSAAVPC